MMNLDSEACLKVNMTVYAVVLCGSTDVQTLFSVVYVYMCVSS